eukprot:3988908-Pleurochrysis_carterae.AAC.1
MDAQASELTAIAGLTRRLVSRANLDDELTHFAQSWVASVAWSPDGAQLATCSGDFTARCTRKARAKPRRFERKWHLHRTKPI